MTDKEKLEAIRAEIHRLVDVRGYDREMANDLFAFMDSLPNEPVSEDFENALAEEWKGYNDRGAAKVDALEDNTQELAFAKGFYRGWHYKKEEPVSEELEKEVNKYFNALYSGWTDEQRKEDFLVEKICTNVARHFANWQKEQDQKSMEIMDEVYFKSCDMIRKQMIDKTCKYLQEHREEVETEDNGISGWISDEFIENFENYMKG